jgi:hypothetical protein
MGIRFANVATHGFGALARKIASKYRYLLHLRYARSTHLLQSLRCRLLFRGPLCIHYTVSRKKKKIRTLNGLESWFAFALDLHALDLYEVSTDIVLGIMPTTYSIKFTTGISKGHAWERGLHWRQRIFLNFSQPGMEVTRTKENMETECASMLLHKYLYPHGFSGEVIDKPVMISED